MHAMHTRYALAQAADEQFDDAWGDQMANAVDIFQTYSCKMKQTSMLIMLKEFVAQTML